MQHQRFWGWLRIAARSCLSCCDFAAPRILLVRRLRWTAWYAAWRRSCCLIAMRLRFTRILHSRPSFLACCFRFSGTMLISCSSNLKNHLHGDGFLYQLAFVLAFSLPTGRLFKKTESQVEGIVGSRGMAFREQLAGNSPLPVLGGRLFYTGSSRSSSGSLINALAHPRYPQSCPLHLNTSPWFARRRRTAISSSRVLQRSDDPIHKTGRRL